jgi:hypothetical protein
LNAQHHKRFLRLKTALVCAPFPAIAILWANF